MSKEQHFFEIEIVCYIRKSLPMWSDRVAVKLSSSFLKSKRKNNVIPPWQLYPEVMIVEVMPVGSGTNHTAVVRY